MPKFHLALTNLQSFIKPKARKLRALTSFVLEEEGCPPGSTISLVLVDDAAIISLNKQYLKHNYATDVLSFNLQEGEALKLPPHQTPPLGEIIISGQTALRQAEERKVIPHKELEHLLVHGILHLLKYEDADPRHKKLMEKRTLELLKKFQNCL
jgi:probable rRNA maturation factor